MMWWNRPERNPRFIVHQHTESIGIMVPSGTYLFTGSQDRTVRVWDAATANCIRTLEGHPSYISGITLSPDSMLLRAACGYGGRGEFRIWDWVTG
jgi:WD40 repeat protein